MKGFLKEGGFFWGGWGGMENVCINAVRRFFFFKYT